VKGKHKKPIRRALPEFENFNKHHDSGNGVPDHVARFLKHFPDAEPTGNGWKARCPVHADSDPSLSIGIGKDGCILLHCFGGCDNEDILAEKGLGLPALFPPKNRPSWQSPYLTNADFEAGNNGEKGAIYPADLGLMLFRLLELTNGQPCRVNNNLFVDDKDHGLSWLESPSQLSAYLKRTTGPVKFYRAPGCVTMEELFHELKRTARQYVAVENLPHQPPFQTHYYTHKAEDISGTVSTGSHLQELVDRFCPETPEDRALIQAAFMTPGWGGLPGARPAFVITADAGRGTGKTSLAQAVGQLWGGILSFSHREDAARILTRLLSTTEALSKRVCLLDNVKTLKFSWSELEAWITAANIGGHKMYIGEASRPNNLTWFITLNGASLSTDMAQRSVIIKLRKPEHSAKWEDGIRAFIEDHRASIIADILAALSSPKKQLKEFTRWGRWEDEILQRLPNPNRLQALIEERQGTVDVEEEEAGEIEVYFAEQLKRNGHNPDRSRIFIQAQRAAQWYCDAMNVKEKVISVSRILTQMITEKRLTRLERTRSHTLGRGFTWTGDKVTPGTKLKKL